MIPVVVSYASATPRHDDVFERTLRTLADSAGRALAEAGFAARWVNAAAPDTPASDLLAHARGVVILGGADVDPVHYGAVPEGAHMDAADAAADAFELALIRGAITAGTPLLTICRGTQLLNVALGGTLVQDLGAGIHRDPRPGAPMLTHTVEVASGTRLADVLGAGTHEIRSGHHQAVDVLGAGLVVSATAPDGVIEAVELPGTDAWVVGVQWHPEEAAADPAHLRALLADFARAAG